MNGVANGMHSDVANTATELDGATKPRFSKKALISAVLGVLGLSGVLFAAAIIAIVLGGSAKEEIDANGERGRPLAVAGVVLGWIGTGVAVMLLALLLFGGSR